MLLCVKEINQEEYQVKYGNEKNDDYDKDRGNGGKESDVEVDSEGSRTEGEAFSGDNWAYERSDSVNISQDKTIMGSFS